jgi:hypothetical protein
VTALPRAILGDNPFFGINHHSEERARAQAVRFRDAAAIIEVLDGAREQGITALMCTTHERMAEVAAHARRNPAYATFDFYPCMPYAHKYANAVTEDGMLGALRRFMPDAGGIGAVVRGGVAAARKDLATVIRILIDTEMRAFEGTRTPYVFLQNIVTDLLLGLGMKDGFAVFADHIRSRYGAEPGFITMNLPMLQSTLSEVGIERPLICANVNAAGFRMCGGEVAYRQAIGSGDCRTIAMSVFASGGLAPRPALEYVRSIDGVDAVVFGASTVSHIAHTKGLIEELWPPVG